MERRSSYLLLMFTVLQIISSVDASHRSAPVPKFDSSYFPDGFFWGTATSAYQTEGEAYGGGRKPSTWDTFTHKFPERIDDGGNGDVAANFYNLYRDDIKRMKKELSMNAFRFSISWSRVVPSGRRSEGVNEEGIDFYNRVIDEAIDNGLEPFVTLFHWDVPQGLEDKYGGFLSQNIVADFKDYAELCFEEFGDRVKHWITINEPFIFTTRSYDSGDLAPGRCSSWVKTACQAGNSATEPYIVGHNVLLAHAAAFNTYKQMDLDGEIGITLDITWSEPYSNSIDDIEAAKINLNFSFGWFMEPLAYGQYPKIMLARVGHRLPPLSEQESQLLKGSYDFIGINYYTANYVSANTTADYDPTHIRYISDIGVNLTKFRNGIPIGLQASPKWLYIFPQGIRYSLNYIKDTYQNPTIYITENGIGDDTSVSSMDALKDIQRVHYFQQHLWNVLKSICEHEVNVKGYFAWSFIDNFEWSNGYTIKMGLYGLDRNNSLARHPKLSVRWFKQFLKKKNSIGGPKCSITKT